MSTADQVVGRPERLAMRHLAVVAQAQLLADVALDTQPRPEARTCLLPRPRPVLAVAAACRRPRRRPVERRPERPLGVAGNQLGT